MSAAYFRDNEKHVHDVMSCPPDPWEVLHSPTRYETIKVGMLMDFFNRKTGVIAALYCDFLFTKIELRIVHDPITVMRAIIPPDREDDEVQPITPRVPEHA